MLVSLLLTTIVIIFIPILIIMHIIKSIKNSTSKKRDLPISIIALIYLVFAAVLLIWSTNTFNFELTDFYIVYSIILTAQTITLISTLFISQNNNNILYSLLAYIPILPLIILNLSNIHFLIPISFLIISLTFLIFSREHKPHITILIIYATISLIFYIISFIARDKIIILTFISSIIFLTFIKTFLKDLETIPEEVYENYGVQQSPILYFLKHFVFIIIITNFIFIGTVSIHELGHISIAKLSNCENTKIVYEIGFLPHAEVNCQDDSEKQRWIMGGILAPFLIAIPLMFSGGKFIREISAEIIGFSLIISYLDIQEIGLSPTIAVFTIISGILLSVVGLALLARSRID